MIKTVDKKDILRLVTKEVKRSRKEILAAMLLREERQNPLPGSYHALLKNKLKDGVKIKRLGFGSRVDYTVVNNKLAMKVNHYQFKYLSRNSAYQRLLIIDRKILFFGVDGMFFQSSYKPLVEVFYKYFNLHFKKGRV